jgi:hypothetical protein
MELKALVKQLVASGIPVAPSTGPAAMVNVGLVTNVGSVTHVTNNFAPANIRPWDGSPADRIAVPLSLMAAAFAESSRLKEYCRLGDDEKTDPKVAPPYVLDILMDLVKRAHADPAARNVYLNPRRADQALVCLKSGRWEVIQLVEATRLLFDGVAVHIRAVTLSDEERRRLPLEAQNALAMADLAYRDEPEEYAKRAKGPMAAHLANTAPRTSALSTEESALAPSLELGLVPSQALGLSLVRPCGEPRVALAPAPPREEPRAALLARGLTVEDVGRRRWIAPKPAPREEKHFAQAEAAALLRSHRPPRVGEVDSAYIKSLARLAGVNTGRVVRKLWEAAEDRLLSGDDDQTARAVCSVYDEDPDQYV